MTFERLLVTHCAPTLANIKCSSLVCLKHLEGSCGDAVRKLSGKGLRFRFLRNGQGCPLLFVYRSTALEKALGKPQAKALLAKYGYDPEDELESKLDLLSVRMKECAFPHEIGLFLGYPAGDVEAFILNKGENYICSGCWKVYENREEAERTFSLYKRCIRIYTECFDKGKTIERLCV